MRAARGRACCYQIKRCSAPCTGEISPADYAELVREARAFLSGKSQAVKEQLAAEMEKASRGARFRARRDLSRPPRGVVRRAIAAGDQSARRRGSRRVRDPSGRRIQSASRSSSSAPARTGATAPISRKPTARCRRRRCCVVPRAVLRRQALPARDPAFATIFRERELAGGGAVGQERLWRRGVGAAARREEAISSIMRSPMRARRSDASSRRHRRSRNC